jgi:hypothetical protein
MPYTEGPTSLRYIEMDSELHHLKAVTNTDGACTELRTQHALTTTDRYFLSAITKQSFCLLCSERTHTTHILVQSWEFVDYENRLASQEGLCPWSRYVGS